MRDGRTLYVTTNVTPKRCNINPFCYIHIYHGSHSQHKDKSPLLFFKILVKLSFTTQNKGGGDYPLYPPPEYATLLSLSLSFSRSLFSSLSHFTPSSLSLSASLYFTPKDRERKYFPPFSRKVKIKTQTGRIFQK